MDSVACSGWLISAAHRCDIFPEGLEHPGAGDRSEPKFRLQHHPFNAHCNEIGDCLCFLLPGGYRWRAGEELGWMVLPGGFNRDFRPFSLFLPQMFSGSQSH